MKIFRFLILILCVRLINTASAFAQSALSQLEQAAGRSISSVNVPMPSAPTAVGAIGSVAKSAAVMSSNSISNAVAGMVIQGLLNNLFSTTPEKTPEQIEAERIEQERLAMEAEKQRLEEEARQQAIHDELINSSKSLSGSGSLDFKSLDGDMESLRKSAADQFEPKSTGSSHYPNSMGTQFFGMPLSDPEVRILIEPESTPVYQDLETSVELTDAYLEEEKLVVEVIGGAVVQAKGEPLIAKPDCKVLSEKLNRYRTDLVRFRSWNSGTLTELKKWEEQNDQAFWNAIGDGAGAAFGVFLDYLEDTRSSASVIRSTFEVNEARFIKDGLITPAQALRYKSILDLRINTSSVAKLTKEGLEIRDYINATRNLIQATTEKLSSTDGECNQLISLLKNEGLLSETPWVDAGQFLAGKIVDKFMDNPSILIKPGTFVKGMTKIPYVTIAQLAVDEAYNITDMLTSYSNICTLREADGRASEAVRKIEADMETIKVQLQGCPSSF